MNTEKKSWFKQLLDGEPFIYYIGFIIPIILIIVLYVCVFTGWTFYGKNVKAAADFWLIVGFLFQVIAVYYVWKKSETAGGVRGEHIALAGALFALGFVAFAGFKFNIA